MAPTVQTTFDQRLLAACKSNPEVPSYGQQAWLRKQLKKRGVVITATAVSNWFSGYTQARPHLLAKVAEILGVDEAWLSGKEPPTSAGSAGRPNIPVSSAATIDLPIPLRPGLIIQIKDLPSDLTLAEAQKLGNVLLAWSKGGGADGLGD